MGVMVGEVFDDGAMVGEVFGDAMGGQYGLICLLLVLFCWVSHAKGLSSTPSKVMCTIHI